MTIGIDSYLFIHFSHWEWNPTVFHTMNKWTLEKDHNTTLDPALNTGLIIIKLWTRMGPVMLNLTRQTIPSLHTYYSWLNTTRATTRFPNSRYKTCLETKNMAYIITRRPSAYPQKPAGSTSSYTRPLPILALKRCIQLHKRTKPKEQTLKIDRSHKHF